MKFVSAAALALIGCLVGFNSANAQGDAMKTTPTTKILAIGTINPGFEQTQVFAVLPEEVRETVDLYLDGKIEQWYSLQGKPGPTGFWRISGHPAVQQAPRNHYFGSLGLPRLYVPDQA